MELPHAAVRVDRVDHRQRQASRTLAEETPIALAYNGTSTAVLMATPADLTEVATGFSLTEAIIRQPCEIEDLDIVRHQDGIELRMWLSPERGHHLSARRRRLVGPTGCGLCGIESLADATPPVPSVTRGFSLTPDQISDAVQLLSDAQELNHATRATHAAGFYLPEAGLTVLREGVGEDGMAERDGMSDADLTTSPMP